MNTKFAIPHDVYWRLREVYAKQFRPSSTPLRFNVLGGAGGSRDS